MRTGAAAGKVGRTTVQRNPTEQDMHACKLIVEGWKKSASGNRYKGDTVDAWALACVRTLATMPSAPPGLANRREFISRGGDSICLNWWRIHPDMGDDTRPDQGFQRRLKTNAALAGISVSWAWCSVNGQFHLVRT